MKSNYTEYLQIRPITANFIEKSLICFLSFKSRLDTVQIAHMLSVEDGRKFTPKKGEFLTPSSSSKRSLKETYNAQNSS